MKYLLAIPLFIAAQVHAQSVIGQVSCGDWVKNPRSSDKAWMLGYMSGLNTLGAMNSGRDDLKQIDANQIFLWMDNYCRTNPLKRTAEGGFELMLELAAKSLKNQ